MPGPLKGGRFRPAPGRQAAARRGLRRRAGAARCVLGDYFGERPVVLAFVYYDCPMLCPMLLDGIAKTLGVLSSSTPARSSTWWRSRSIPRETPADGRGPEAATTVKRYGREPTAGGWHFLTAPREAGEESDPQGHRGGGLPLRLGARRASEFAHASGMIVAHARTAPSPNTSTASTSRPRTSAWRWSRLPPKPDRLGGRPDCCSTASATTPS